MDLTMAFPNRSLAERCADALKEAGEAKALAHRLRKKADRIGDLCLLKATGKNADERKATARSMAEYVVADDAATEAECAAITTKAECDAEQIMFEAWRTEEASRRQDSKFIGAYGSVTRPA